MKSVRYLLLLSSQLALQIGLTRSLPIVKSLSTTGIEGISIDSAHPVIKRDVIIDVDLSKRGVSELEASPSQKAKSKAKEIASLPSKEHATSHKGKEIAESKEASTEQQSSTSINNNNKKAISSARYHAKGAGIEFKKAGLELFHGPVRAVTEVPASGMIGLVKHMGVSCRYVTTCQLGKAGHHFFSGIGKAAMGTFLTPLAAVSVGAYNAGGPIIRGGYHSVAMTGNGIKEVLDRVRGKKVDKDISRTSLLEEAKAINRASKTRQFTTEEASQLRSTYWNSPVDEKTNKVITHSHSFDWDEGIFGKNNKGSCFGGGGCGEGTIGTGTIGASFYG
jgi:hypothetical protein